MAVVYRNGRPYLYESVRRNGRVTSEYKGCGELAFLAGQVDRLVREQEDAETAVFEAEREEMDAAERVVVDYFNRVEDLTRAALLACGFHQHKRQWRRRRVPKQSA